jgi:hypothetical protein
MANFLERLLKGQLQKTSGSELDVRRDKVPEPALPHVPRTPPANPACEKSILNCVCASEDKPYQLVFVRNRTTGKLRLLESVKLAGEARAGSANSRRTVPPQTIPIAEIEGEHPCAWCGSRNVCGPCTGCGTLVCSARWAGPGELFHCRDSCGATWPTTPMQEVTATKEDARPPGPQTAPRSERLPAVAPASLRDTLPADPGSRALVIRK